MNIVTRQVGSYEVNYAEDAPCVVPSAFVREGEEILSRWAPHFPREDTWVQQTCGVPSLIVRIDGTMLPDGRLGVYEVEERPAGVGMTKLMSQDFSGRLGAFQAHWPDFKCYVSPQRAEFDDHLWLASADGDPACLVLPRVDPGDPCAPDLVCRSVSALLRKGDKSYGVALGWWRPVSLPEAEELPWDGGFALKPLQGSKCREMCIFCDRRQWGKHGVASRTKVRQMLTEQGTMYCQPFIPPVASGIASFPYLIYRIFYGYHPSQYRWAYLGGAANLRPNVKVHGARDALFLPLVTR